MSALIWLLLENASFRSMSTTRAFQLHIEHTSAYVGVRRRTSAYVSIHQHTWEHSNCTDSDAQRPQRDWVLERNSALARKYTQTTHDPNYTCDCENVSPSDFDFPNVCVCGCVYRVVVCVLMDECVSAHPSAYVNIRQHTSAYVSIRLRIRSKQSSSQATYAQSRVRVKLTPQE
jgi:hypothetical protein